MYKSSDESYVYKFLRVLIYIIEIILLFSLQQIPWVIPQIRGGRPFLLIPLFICVSIFEGNFSGLIFGVIFGILFDGYYDGFIGTFTVVMGIMGYLLGKLKENIFEIKFFTFLFLCIILEPMLIFLRLYLNYYFIGLDDIKLAIVNQVMPCIIYTLVISPVIYFFNRPIAYFIKDKGGV